MNKIFACIVFTATSGFSFAVATAMPLVPMGTEQAITELSFPYAFPSAGRYRVWVQLRVRGRVRTAAWDVDVR